MVIRAHLVPSISSALANLTSTQSPVLRQKVEDLARRQSLDIPHEGISGDLDKRLLVLLLRATYYQRTKVRGPNTTKQPRTYVDELIQNDQLGGLDGRKVSRSIGSAHDNPLNHGLQSYSQIDDASEAPASRLLRGYKPWNEDMFDNFEEDLEYQEHFEESNLVPLETMCYSSSQIRSEGTQTEFQQHFDPDDMDSGDIMEENNLYTTRDYDQSYHQQHLFFDGVYPQTLTEDAPVSQMEYMGPAYMNDNEEPFDGGEDHWVDEELLQPQTALDDTHNVDLVAGTLPCVARDRGLCRHETSHFVEGRGIPACALEDRFEEYRDADEAFECAVSHYENAGPYARQLVEQDQDEGRSCEELDEDCAYDPPEYCAHGELYDPEMHNVPGRDVDIRGNPLSGSIGHVYDYRTEVICGSGYTCRYDRAGDIESETTASYGYSNRFTHGLDQIPRPYLHIDTTYWTRSTGLDQDVVETRPSQRDIVEYGVTQEQEQERSYYQAYWAHEENS